MGETDQDSTAAIIHEVAQQLYALVTPAHDLKQIMRAVEQKVVDIALVDYGNHSIAAVARRLGVDRVNLYRAYMWHGKAAPKKPRT